LCFRSRPEAGTVYLTN